MVRDLNDLLTFTQVVDGGSFTAAAGVLGLPKSTVSRRVSRLEDQLGVRLLQRTTRKLNLTDAGRTLYERSARIMADVDDAERAVTRLSEEPRGRLRVTAPVELPLVNELISDFLTQYPEVQIDLDLANRHVDLVEEGFDVAIRAGQLRDSALIAQKLGQSYRVLVASPDYLARRGVPETVAALAEHDCILFGPWSGKATWTLVGAEDRGAGGRVKVAVGGRLSVNHLLAVRHGALAGFGIALLPADWIERDVAAGKLRQVLPDYRTPAVALSAVYPSRKLVATTVRVFVDFLKQRFADGGVRPVFDGG